jgi:hypothetical protein
MSPPTPAPPPVPAPPPTPPESAPANERWFAGRLPRSKADELLEAVGPGTYLVRESDSRPVRVCVCVCVCVYLFVDDLLFPRLVRCRRVQGDYSLSVVYGAVKHIKINRRGIKYEVAPDARAFSTVQVRALCAMSATFMRGTCR